MDTFFVYKGDMSEIIDIQDEDISLDQMRL